MSHLKDISERFRSLIKHQGVQRYAWNTSWVFVSKATSLVLSFFLFSYITRYLGPANFGNLSYAQGFVSLMSAFASFGIDHVLYRDLVQHKDRRDELLGTAITIKLVLGTIVSIATILAAFLTETEPLLVWMIGIMSLSFIFQPFTLPSLYFDAVQRSKLNTIASLSSSTILAIVKILIIIFDKGIIFFSGAVVLEVALSGLFFVMMYARYIDSPAKWRARMAIVRPLLTQSFPLLLASLSSVIYSRIDQVMLKHYLDASAVGIYSVAARVAEFWNFIPGLVIFSLFPAIVNAKIISERSYERRFGKLLAGVTVLSVTVAIGISILAAPLVQLLAGGEYLAAIAPLRIYIWGVVAMVIVSTFQQLLVAEGWTKITFYMTMGGAISNILLNLWFIPQWGIMGAAAATLIAYWVSPLSLLVFSHTRHKIVSVVRAQRND